MFLRHVLFREIDGVRGSDRGRAGLDGSGRIVAGRTDRGQMFGQEPDKLHIANLFHMLDPEMNDFAMGSRGSDRRFGTEVRDATKRGGVFGSREMQPQSIDFFRLNAAPGLVLFGDREVDDLFVVPEPFPGGGEFSQQGHQFFEHFKFPLDFLAGRESFADKVPFLAEFRPGHMLFQVRIDAIEPGLESSD